MSQTSATTSSRLNYQSIFDNALEVYRKKTGKDLRSHPLLSKLENSDSPDAVLNTLRQEIPGFDQSGSSNDDNKLTKWLDPTVKVLIAFSSTIGNGVSLAYPPAGVIFSGIGVLLSAVQAASDSEGTLVELFERIEGFFRRLEAYIDVPSNAGMTDTIVKIMAEVLFILAIATREIKQNKAKRFLKRLVGRRDIEDALQRLEHLTREEIRMAVAQGLKATHGVAHAVADIGGEVRGVGDQVISGVEKLGQQIAKEFGDLSRGQRQDRIKSWLSPPDHSLNFNIASDARHEGTAEWFIQSSTFHDWKMSGSFLWIHGKPGSGKSVFTSAIIQNIKVIYNVGSAYMAYFFFDFKDTGKQGVHSLLSSILIQLSHQSDTFCNILLASYSAHYHGLEKPTDRALTQCFEDMLGAPGETPLYLIIDALDECPITTGTSSPRDKVLALVEKVVGLNLPHLRLCITSRPEIDIRNTLEPLTSNCISLHNQSGQKKDIADFVRSKVESDKNMRRWRNEDRVLVIETLADKADGMFRWVVCQLEVLRHCLPPSVRRILAELPESLDETYERILLDIPKANQEHTHRLLQCLTVAFRPLKVDELAEVLAIEFSATGGTPGLNEDLRWKDQEQAVISACSSLISIIDDGDSRIVQFSHFSVKEFLTSDRLAGSNAVGLGYHHIRFEPAHTIMAMACVSVLLRLDYFIDRQSLKSFPLAKYSADHFAKHADFDSVISHIQDRIDLLFDTEKPHLAVWRWAASPLGRRNPEKLTGNPLHYMSEFGSPGLARYLISKQPQYLHATVDELGTPLHQAAGGANEDIFRILLGQCVDVDVRDFEDRTPLHRAAYWGRIEKCRILVERGADVNARNGNIETPLHRVLDLLYEDGDDDRYIDVIRFFLRHGADVNAQDINHLTPLHVASREGCPKVVKILLEHGADVDAQDINHSTPLHVASGEGSLKVVELLLEHGADARMKNSEGQTPIQIASEEYAEEIVQLLSRHAQSESHT